MKLNYVNEAIFESKIVDVDDEMYGIFDKIRLNTTGVYPEIFPTEDGKILKMIVNVGKTKLDGENLTHAYRITIEKNMKNDENILI